MMRRVLALLVACAGCASAAPARSLAPDQAPRAYEVPPPVPADAPPPRPRLSRTITLGEGELSFGAPPQPAEAPSTPEPAAAQQAPLLLWGYGPYGMSPRAFGDGARAPAPGWGSSGWEGPRRTAAPGQTPGIGGNWPAPPSYGPAPMK